MLFQRMVFMRFSIRSEGGYRGISKERATEGAIIALMEKKKKEKWKRHEYTASVYLFCVHFTPKKKGMYAKPPGSIPEDLVKGK